MTRVLSFVIAVVLTLQFAAAFDFFPLLLSRSSNSFWPFISYPMYRSAHYEGAVLPRFRVFGRTLAGSDVEITPPDLGLNLRKFQDIFVAALRQPDMPLVDAFAEIYRRRTGMRLIAIRLERHGQVLTRDGLQAAPAVQLAVLSLSPR
jgi:hypothetical protein